MRASIYEYFVELGILQGLRRLAQHLFDSDFKDVINDAIFEVAKELGVVGFAFRMGVASAIYEVVPEGEQARVLVADLVTLTASWDTIAGSGPAQAWVDV